MSDVTKFIPHSARLWCERCEEFYDFRDKPDRSCPECSLPPPTIREQVYDEEGKPVSGRIIPNPAHAAALAVHQPDHPARGRGRPRQYASDAERKAASRARQALQEDPTGG